MDETRPAIPYGTDPGLYRSYLLRVWREQAGLPWRCQVQWVGSGRVRRFDGQAGLFEFLAAELGDAADTGSKEEGALPADGVQKGGGAGQDRLPVGKTG